MDLSLQGMRSAFGERAQSCFEVVAPGGARLRCAQAGFDHALDAQRFDERFRRIWRVYLVGCAKMFRSPAGQTHLFQVLFSNGNVTWASSPMTREHVHA
jgi:hypothetical protein